jgi:alpha-mannosidase
VALLNDCKYGFKAYRNVLDINLLRSPLFPDPVADRAQHEFSYSIFPHAANYIQAEVYKQGYELNVPMRVVSVAQQTGQLEKAYSFVELSQANIMIEAVKKAEDSEDLIIRLYELPDRIRILSLLLVKTTQPYI